MVERIADLVSTYLLTADPQFLKLVHDIVQAEIDAPVLQKTLLQVNTLTSGQLTKALLRQNCVVLSADACTNYRIVDGEAVHSPDAILEEGKLIRIYGSEWSIPHDECILCHLVSFDGGRVLLSVPGETTNDD